MMTKNHFSSFLVAAAFVVACFSCVASANPTLRPGVYCGGSSDSDYAVSMQIAEIYAAIQVTHNKTTCEVQFVFSNHKPGGVNDVPVSTHYSDCGTMLALVGPEIVRFPDVSAGGWPSLSFSLMRTSDHTEILVAVSQGGVTCPPESQPSWIPVGTYCDNLMGSSALAVAPRNSFVVDLLGACSIRGTYQINVSTGVATLKQTSSTCGNVLQYLSSSSYDALTNTLTLSGSFQGMTVSVKGSRLLCDAPPIPQIPDGVVSAGTYCGYSSTDFMGLTLTATGGFLLSVGVCTGQGVYMVNEPRPGGQPRTTISLFFKTYVDCFSNIHVSSANITDSTTIAALVYGGNNNNNNNNNNPTTGAEGAETTGMPMAQQITLKLSSAIASPIDAQQCSNLTQSGMSVPAGLYCLPAISDAIPAGALSVAIFGRNQYQIWAGPCEAHGSFTVDSNGLITFTEMLVHSSCPTAVEVLSAQWDPYKSILKISARYNVITFSLAASQSQCVALTPAGQAVPSGLYCDKYTLSQSWAGASAAAGAGSAASAAVNKEIVTVSGTNMEISIGDSCTVSGEYTLNDNGVVSLSITAINNCIDLFLHTIKYRPASSLGPAQLRFLGFFDGNAMNFTALNCTARLEQQKKAAAPEAMFCFATDAGGSVGFATLDADQAKVTVGKCVVSGVYTTSLTNQIMFVRLGRTSACGATTYNILSWTADHQELNLQQEPDATAGGVPVAFTTSQSACPRPPPPPASTPAPTTEAPPVTIPPQTTLAPAPVSSTVPPVVNTPAPVVNTASPTVNTPAPPANTPAPRANTPAPVANTPSPPVNTPTPDKQTIKPTAASTTRSPASPSNTPGGAFAAGREWAFSISSVNQDGTLTMQANNVASLQVGDCTQTGMLVADGSSFNFVASSSSSGCTTLTLSGFAFKVAESGGSETVSVSGSVNGNTVSAAAVDAGPTGQPPKRDSTSGPPVAIIAGFVAGAVVLVLIGLYLYKRISLSGAGSGTGAGRTVNSDGTVAFNSMHGIQNHTEMLADIAYSSYAVSDRASTGGREDSRGIIDAL